MQIGSGPSPLSLAILKTLGAQPSAGAQPAATPPAAMPAGKAAAAASPRTGAADIAATAAGDRSPPPRGSFVDLRA
ncbi:MAG: hypothetical protein ACFCUW_15900 [Kiloniellaceae bacterium]